MVDIDIIRDSMNSGGREAARHMSKVSLRRLNQRDNAVKRDLNYIVEMLNKQAMAIYSLDERIAKLEKPAEKEVA